MIAPLVRLVLISGAVVVLDQLTKFLVMAAIPFQTSRPVLGDLVRLTYIKNQGIAFGLFSDRDLPFAVVSIVAMFLIVFSFRRLPRDATASRFAMAAILGGAAGNLIDRLRFGEVVDFVDIGLGTLRWPVFNVADVAVTTGVLLFVATSFLRRDDRRDERREELEAEGTPLGPV